LVVYVQELEVVLKKRWAVVTLVVAFALGISACGASNSSGTSAAPLQIGLIEDLTGPTAALGKGNKLSAELGVDAINAAGGVNGRKIELKIYDDAGSPAKTTEATTRLAYSDKVAAIICSYTSSAAAACGAVAGQAKVPMVTSATVDSLTASSAAWYGWVFRSTVGVAATVKFLTGYVVQNGYKNVAIAHSSLVYGTSATATMKQALTANGVRVTGDVSLEPTTTDASIQAAQLKQMNPEAVVTFDYPVPTAQLVKSLRTLGYKGPIITNQSGMNSAMFGIAGSMATDIHAVDSYDPSNKDAAAAAKAFEKATGQPPFNYQQMYEYVNVQVVAEALRHSSGTSGAAVQAGFHKISCLKAAVGKAGTCISFTGDQNFEGSGPDTNLMKYLKSGSTGADWTAETYTYKA
jgi:branched-chain amino acid transport system substrate-binding protein